MRQVLELSSYFKFRQIPSPDKTEVRNPRYLLWNNAAVKPGAIDKRRSRIKKSLSIVPADFQGSCCRVLRSAPEALWEAYCQTGQLASQRNLFPWEVITGYCFDVSLFAGLRGGNSPLLYGTNSLDILASFPWAPERFAIYEMSSLQILQIPSYSFEVHDPLSVFMFPALSLSHRLLRGWAGKTPNEGRGRPSSTGVRPPSLPPPQQRRSNCPCK